MADSKEAETQRPENEERPVEITGREARQAEVVLKSPQAKKIFWGTLGFIVLLPLLLMFLLALF
jgi:ribosomal protein L11